MGGTVGGSYDLVIAERDSLHRYLRLRVGYRAPTPADLRYLRALARTAAELGPAVHDTSAEDEIDAFLDSVARSIFEQPLEENGT